MLEQRQQWQIACTFPVFIIVTALFQRPISMLMPEPWLGCELVWIALFFHRITQSKKRRLLQSSGAHVNRTSGLLWTSRFYNIIYWSLFILFYFFFISNSVELDWIILWRGIIVIDSGGFFFSLLRLVLNCRFSLRRGFTRIIYLWYVNG